MSAVQQQLTGVLGGRLCVQLMALMLQSRINTVFAIDIHPAAQLGKGILLDHGTGVVIGETAVVGNNVSLMQNVTLGGRLPHVLHMFLGTALS